MNKIWSDDAWEDYLWWQSRDRRTLRRINQLIKDIERNGCATGIGKPEPLTGSLKGEFSRRIDEKNRLVYHMEGGKLYIVHCRGHYDRGQARRNVGQEYCAAERLAVCSPCSGGNPSMNPGFMPMSQMAQRGSSA